MLSVSSVAPPHSLRPLTFDRLHRHCLGSHLRRSRRRPHSLLHVRPCLGLWSGFQLTFCLRTGDTRTYFSEAYYRFRPHLASRGLQLLTSVVVADITDLKWRGFVSGMTSAPFIINAFVGANISTGILTHANWRWGCTCLVSSPLQASFRLTML